MACALLWPLPLYYYVVDMEDISGCSFTVAVIVCAQDRLLNSGLLEAARASWWHSIFLESAGSKFGRGVYWDTTNFQVRRTCTNRNCHA